MKEIFSTTTLDSALRIQSSAADGESGTQTSTNNTEAIFPFKVQFEEAALTDLRKRIKATKWPKKETVPDASQGVQLATIQKLAMYWSTDYDWRKAEAKLNSYPSFITKIDGLDFHFIHVRSKHLDALPIIVTHGWPGSIIEQLKIIEPLTDPTAHGGKPEDAFDVVIPSLGQKKALTEAPDAAAGHFRVPKVL